MKKYKVISFDMFQTLVNVNERIPVIWKRLYGNQYTKDLGMAAAKAVVDNIPAAYEKSIYPFRNMEEMFFDVAEHAKKQVGFEAEPEEAAYQLMYQHGFAPFYEEVPALMDRIAKDFTIIISSDASHLMIEPIIGKLKADRVFISDDLECYKGDHSGKFFQTVLDEMNIEPDKILHIGDSSADIIGADSVGMDSCWINREQRTWKGSIAPDYIIHSLNDILRIIIN